MVALSALALGLGAICAEALSGGGPVPADLADRILAHGPVLLLYALALGLLHWRGERLARPARHASRRFSAWRRRRWKGGRGLRDFRRADEGAILAAAILASLLLLWLVPGNGWLLAILLVTGLIYGRLVLNLSAGLGYRLRLAAPLLFLLGGAVGWLASL